MIVLLLALGAALLGIGAGSSPSPPPPQSPPPPASEPDWRERQIEWALAGTGRGARSLVIQPGYWGGCDKGPPEVRVRETGRRIVVEAVVLEPEDIASRICPAIAGVSEPERVRLKAPVAGRRVTGPERATAPGAAIPQLPDAERRVPRVVGLAATDARSALCGWQLRARGATGDRVVVRQRPRPGTPLPPAGTRPETCGDLPATPVVRIAAR